jgi:hypothetical protein
MRFQNRNDRLSKVIKADVDGDSNPLPFGTGEIGDVFGCFPDAL